MFCILLVDQVGLLCAHALFPVFFLIVGDFSCPVFKSTDSSACSNLLLNLFSEYLSSLTVLSRVSFWFGFVLDNIKIISPLFIYCFLDVVHSSFSSLSDLYDGCFKVLGMSTM